MKRIVLLMITLLLAACSDNAQGDWVAQNIPKEEKQVSPTYEAEVPIYSPTSTTTGLVIHQEGRDKWILVNAQDISGHPNVLVHPKFLTKGDVEGIDVEHNIAIVHIRNSYDFDVLQLVDETITNGVDFESGKIAYFETTLNDELIKTPAKQIQQLLNKTIDEPITWQERYEKNEQLQKDKVQPITNFTTYYEKNIFTYNSDELMHFAVSFIDQFNSSIDTNDWQLISSYLSSDEVREELQFVSKKIMNYEVREVRKEGVYYFVNGINEQREEVRLSIIRDQGNFKIIGTNLINEDMHYEEKLPVIDLNNAHKMEDLPALQMFINGHINKILIVPFETNEKWKLEKKDKKIVVKVNTTKNSTTSFTCSELELNDESNGKFVQLIGCSNLDQSTIQLGETH
ncbi:MAG: hypothetical protein ABS944_17345 [Solibacillus sp.]|uniref:hypothetical protein n=1 Tax=unclassified Solibacillus TaxID=2637870 RepID=UPI0030F5095F